MLARSRVVVEAGPLRVWRAAAYRVMEGFGLSETQTGKVEETR